MFTFLSKTGEFMSTNLFPVVQMSHQTKRYVGMSLFAFCKYDDDGLIRVGVDVGRGIPKGGVTVYFHKGVV